METIGSFVVILGGVFLIAYIYSIFTSKREDLEKEFKYYKEASYSFHKRAQYFNMKTDEKEIRLLLNELKLQPEIKSEILKYESNLQLVKDESDKRNIFLFNHLETIWKCFILEPSEQKMYCFILPEKILFERIAKILDSQKMAEKFINEAISKDSIYKKDNTYTLLAVSVSHPYKRNQFKKPIFFRLTENSKFDEIIEFKS